MSVRRHIALIVGVLALFAAGFTASANATPAATTHDAGTHVVVPFGPCNYSGSHPTIRQGSSGGVVAHAQCLLRNVRGHGSVVVDGAFGPVTRAAVVAEQRRCRIAQDGIVGPQTWRCLHP